MMNQVTNTFKVNRSDTLGKDKIMIAVVITAPDSKKELIVNHNPPDTRYSGTIFTVIDRRKPSWLGCQRCSEQRAEIHLNKETMIKLIIELSKML